MIHFSDIVPAYPLQLAQVPADECITYVYISKFKKLQILEEACQVPHSTKKRTGDREPCYQTYVRFVWL